MTFNKWTDIEGFHNVRKAVNKYDLYHGSITYRGKIKLHGTNAGIIVKPNGDVFAQSRSAIIGTGNDNAGFAAWVEKTKTNWLENRIDNPPITEQFTVYGEWCGKGVQKGVAISQVENKQFIIFTIQIGVYDENGNANMIIDPDAIKDYLDCAGVVLPDNVHILPWYAGEITLDYEDDGSLQTAALIMNDAVNVVEQCDPWVKETFGIDGVGEGIVYYPISFQKNGIIDRWHMSTFMFKAKGEKHKGTKQKKAVQLDPETVASIDEFVTLVVTESRLEQGAMEVNRGVLDFDTKLIGPFLKWFNGDVIKECTDELEASGLEWKQVSKGVGNAARTWYLNKCKEF